MMEDGSDSLLTYENDLVRPPFRSALATSAFNPLISYFRKYQSAIALCDRQQDSSAALACRQLRLVEVSGHPKFGEDHFSGTSQKKEHTNVKTHMKPLVFSKGNS